MADTQEIQIPAGWVRNAAGNLVHENEISEQDKLRDRVVMDIAAVALRLNGELKALKEKALADIHDLITIAGEKYDMKLGGPKGNVSLLSFDGRFKLKRIHQDSIGYTEEMEVAKAKVFECISRWGQTVHEDAHKHLFTLATRAFRPTKSGEISISRVTDMLRAEINDPDWRKAKQAVQDSLIVNGKAVYIQVQERVEGKKYSTILLDIAGV
ncbi:DUF3164 family protein [Pseudomonas aeruginosa]|uniref:DUF3164 family protein n=1 Tax=Pseudomonas aeruginosa TaxID=287 RepID=UPI000936CA88|nr:DUF3164 family protein [Pseudomonas aeruginosa]RCM51468.1 hypothetical protein PA82_03359 [Pseudomonas aeruginosa]HCT4763188.1 DUF3164 family protein [Pseudomonas aeruginosa]HDZ6692556.1 DUF3164 family protein [Pseudomonas aeruginosa]